MKKKKKVLLILLIVIILLGIGLGIYFSFRNKNNNDNIKEEDKKIEVVDNLNLSLGSSIPTFNDFVNDEAVEGDIAIYYQDTLVEEDTLDNFGVYDVEITIDGVVYKSVITINDEDAPELVLKEVSITAGKSYDINDFVESCIDNSKEDCEIDYQDKNMAKYTDAGSYDIVIVAKDKSGNEVSKKTVLTVTAKKSNTSSSSSSNSSSNNSSSSSSSSSSKVTQVDTIEQKNLVEEKYKYGIKISVYEKIYIAVYSDGSQKEINRVSITEYDQSTFNATTDDLKDEALTVVSKNAAIISEILNSVNELRSNVGVAALTNDSDLNLAATIRAMEMGYAKVFSHTRPDGRSCNTVLKDLGISFSFMGENIASGQTSAASAMKSWTNSSGHYANMIGSNYTKLGVGYFTFRGNTYWVQIFT